MHINICTLLWTLASSCSALAMGQTSGGQSQNLTASDFSNMTIWQAIERIANSTGSSSNATSEQNGITGMASALKRNTALASALNQTNEGPFIVFLPVDNTLRKYNVFQQFNASSENEEEQEASVVLPLSNANATSGVQQNATSNTFTVPLSSLLYYHVGNLSATIGSANSLAYPPQILANHTQITASQDGSNATQGKQWIKQDTSGVLVLPSLLNATEFFNLNSTANPNIKNQVLIYNQTLGSNNGRGGVFSRRPIFGTRQNANEGQQNATVMISHGLLDKPVQALDWNQAQQLGLYSNISLSNGLLFLIDDLLAPPVNISTITGYYQTSSNVTSSSNTASNATTVPQFGKFFSLLNQTSFYPMVNSTAGLTIFALDDETLAGMNLPSQNQTSSNNNTASGGSFNITNLSDFDKLMANQIVNNTALYSSLLFNVAASSGNMTSSQAGQNQTSTTPILMTLLNNPLNVTFHTSDNNNSNNSSAISNLSLNQTVSIKQADLLLTNGVAHSVNAFFNMTGLNRTASQMETSDASFAHLLHFF